MIHDSTILEVAGLSHVYHAGNRPVPIFHDVGFTVAAGELLAVQGASGSGKTTLLLACGGMRRPTQGQVRVQGQDLFALTPSRRVAFRSAQVGYLFQTLELVPYLTVLENVRLSPSADLQEALRWLERLGLDHRLNHRPQALSQGERQRAALVRAIAHRPALLIADEPTGNLDEVNSQLVFESLRQFASAGAAVLVASHDSKIKALADRTLDMETLASPLAPNSSDSSDSSIEGVPSAVPSTAPSNTHATAVEKGMAQ